jgi:hypothetical protein
VLRRRFGMTRRERLVILWTRSKWRRFLCHTWLYDSITTYVFHLKKLLIVSLPEPKSPYSRRTPCLESIGTPRVDFGRDPNYA